MARAASGDVQDDAAEEPSASHDRSAAAHRPARRSWGVGDPRSAGVAPAGPAVPAAAHAGRAPGASGWLASRDGRPVGPSGLGVPGLAGGAAELGGEAVSELALDPGLVPAVAGGEADQLVPLQVVAQDAVDLPR